MMRTEGQSGLACLANEVIVSVVQGDSFALAYAGESTRYGIVEDVLDHEVSGYVNENKKFQIRSWG